MRWGLVFVLCGLLACSLETKPKSTGGQLGDLPDNSGGDGDSGGTGGAGGDGDGSGGLGGDGDATGGDGDGSATGGLGGDGDGSGGVGGDGDSSSGGQGGGTGGLDGSGGGFGPGTAPYNLCRETADCRSDLECIDISGGFGMVFGLQTTQCTKRCNVDGECPAAETGESRPTCVADSCALDCSLDTTCPDGQACVNISGNGGARSLCGTLF